MKEQELRFAVVHAHCINLKIPQSHNQLYNDLANRFFARGHTYSRLKSKVSKDRLVKVMLQVCGVIPDLEDPIIFLLEFLRQLNSKGFEDILDKYDDVNSLKYEEEVSDLIEKLTRTLR